MSDILFKRKIPVKYEVDVFVAGGGPAGTAAAVTAANEGKKVFLAEWHSCFGGMSTAGLIPIFMQFDDGVNFLAGRFGRRVLDNLLAQGGTEEGGKYYPIHAETLKRVYDEMMVKNGAEFSFYTKVIDVEKDGEIISAVICAGKNGIFAVKAKVYIDCTGDGDMAVMAGEDFDKGDENGDVMPATVCSLWANLDWERINKPADRGHCEFLEKAFKEKMFTVEDRHHSGIAKNGDSIGSGNIGHCFGADGTDEVSITKALLTGRKYLPEYQRYYRKFIEGFEKAELAASGSLLGVRETRRIRGKYVLCADDFIERANFEDEIGRYCYEVDIHPKKSDKKSLEKFKKETKKYRYGKGESYGIPLRILTPVKTANLLTAGRCVSSDRYMQSSIRTIPGCYITGQASGMTAAVAVDSNRKCCEVNIELLQKKLKKIGAYI